MSSLLDLPGLLNVKKGENMIHWHFKKKVQPQAYISKRRHGRRPPRLPTQAGTSTGSGAQLPAVASCPPCPDDVPEPVEAPVSRHYRKNDNGSGKQVPSSKRVLNKRSGPFLITRVTKCTSRPLSWDFLRIQWAAA